MNVYPFKFKPIYKEKIWGGRNLERLFGRRLPEGKLIGESWELADLAEGTSVVSNGPLAGRTLTELTHELGADLLGGVSPMPDGRFPLLLKLLDANDILSLQVHPDARAVGEIGGGAALKTECWYVLESRGGYIYKGVLPGVGPEAFREAIEAETVGKLARRIDCRAGDFHFLPAGIVHAIGAGLVVAEVQTPSDTTYRVTDWGRGREIHVERSMQCIRFDLTGDEPPGAQGETLLTTEYFTVSLRKNTPNAPQPLPVGRCCALMILAGSGGGGGSVEVRCDGAVETHVPVQAGDTILVPAGVRSPVLLATTSCEWLEVTLGNG